jgi:hypothetical protein
MCVLRVARKSRLTLDSDVCSEAGDTIAAPRRASIQNETAEAFGGKHGLGLEESFCAKTR